MDDASRDSHEGACPCPRCIRDLARVENWLNESGPGPPEVPRNSTIRWGTSPTRSSPPSRSLVPVSDKDSSHVPTAHAFTLRAEFAAFKNDCRKASRLGDRTSIPSSVEKCFSELFDKKGNLEDFLEYFKIVGYNLKEALCKIHRRTGHPNYTLYEGNPEPDQQSLYHHCEFNSDHLLVNNSGFKASGGEYQKHIFA